MSDRQMSFYSLCASMKHVKVLRLWSFTKEPSKIYLIPSFRSFIFLFSFWNKWFPLVVLSWKGPDSVKYWSFLCVLLAGNKSVWVTSLMLSWVIIDSSFTHSLGSEGNVTAGSSKHATPYNIKKKNRKTFSHQETCIILCLGYLNVIEG